MKVLLFSHGTRGDVQPFAALARALTHAGHEAVLATNAPLAHLAEPYGIRFAPLFDRYDTLSNDPVVRAGYETNFRGLRGKRLAAALFRRYQPMMARVLDDMAAIGDEGADLVVHLPNLPGHEIAERLGVPAALACLQPGWVPTSAFANPLIPLRLPRPLNRASYLTSRLWVHGQLGNTSRWRRDVLDLPRRRGSRNMLRRPDGAATTVLHAFSRHLLPERTDYPSWVHTTGFWFLPAPPQWTPPASLDRFLRAGEPPVYLGFGSVAGTDPVHAGHVVAEAVRLAGMRAVVVTGSGGISAEPLSGGNVFVAEETPFDWLFPQVAAVVHHGGAGTLSAALAAGRPQVICPFMYEQPFNAARMHAAGVATAPLPQSTLTAEKLAAAIERAVDDPALTVRAQELGALIRAENGAATAAELLETLVADGARTH
ncbi:glycosyltransferase [Jiangella alkaliphila]|uniref:Sterol 3beta-glucosyltransferase n=1 Tax=Jiangella alkaliphila TaxID=419479 RepID=A0A1H2K3M2_9ACTN|nr:glycosyltransferase [Jiangella alkaliphila]SDU63324.1 sterol 3beta-glucosyltransferase [Jiangella alkaliphila]